MSSKQEYISYIKDQLRKGVVDPGKVCGLFCTKFDKSRQTFYNHWETAQNEYKIEAESIEKQKEALHSTEELEAVKLGLLTKIKAKQLLTEMATGKNGYKVNGRVVVPSFKDRNAAIELFGKIDGWFNDNDKTQPITVIINSDGIVLESDKI